MQNVPSSVPPMWPVDVAGLRRLLLLSLQTGTVPQTGAGDCPQAGNFASGSPLTKPATPAPCWAFSRIMMHGINNLRVFLPLRRNILKILPSRAGEDLKLPGGYRREIGNTMKSREDGSQLPLLVSSYVQSLSPSKDYTSSYSSSYSIVSISSTSIRSSEM
jgi:hypothetical protein